MNFIKNETAEKLRGGYYTPVDLATYAAQWVAEIAPSRVLEPSCGDGAFLEAVANASLTGAEITAFELNLTEAAKASERARALDLNAVVAPEDFLRWALNHMGEGGQRFDAVLGNPPFIRYQYLPAAFQAEAEKIFALRSCKFTKHTNAWVPFVIASVALLRPGGRLAMVVPSELIHVLHAQSLRTFLIEQCDKVVLVDPEEIWFEDTLQGVVLLLAEKKSAPDSAGKGLGLVPVKGRSFLRSAPSKLFANAPALDGAAIESKWTAAFLDQSVRDVLQEIESAGKFARFKTLAHVEVGIVTGANKFFLVDDETVATKGLERWAHPMFGRSEHSPGVVYDNAQHDRNKALGLPANFLWFKGPDVGKDKKALAYIKDGESDELHLRYKCRIREPWYTVPSVANSSIGMLKRCHNAPKLVLNKAGAFTTDTAYRIETIAIRPSAFVSNFINPATALSAELEGRTYGGGVLELVPSEINRLLVPKLTKAATPIDALDKQIRKEKMPRVQMTHGMKVLKASGLTDPNAKLILDAWIKLKSRRQRIESAESEVDPST